MAEEKKMCYTVSKGQGVQKMSVKVEVKLDAESMADFMIYHIYTSGAGVAALVLGMLNRLCHAEAVSAGGRVLSVCDPRICSISCFYKKKSGEADAEFQTS